jgi:polyhydroxyalkanoate synthesis regulator phasin
MPQNDGLRRYLEAGISLSQITRSRAEDLVRDLIATGEVERNRAQDWVEDLVKSSRDRSEAFVTAIHKEVRRQLDELDLTNLDELARRVAEILAKGQAAARNAGHRRPSTSSKKPAAAPSAAKATAKKAPVKKAVANKAPVKKAAAKKTPATKATAKKAPVKKAVAKKAPPRSGRSA